jgi:carbonic anhydrase/acetyltransferase-like protein (isoleucine patch superfamily)
MLQRLIRACKLHVLCGDDYCRYARMLGVTLGPGCRILDVPEKVVGSEPFLVTLGKHVSITGRARFVTHEGGLWDNVFIGLNAIVLPNVTIGSDVIVAAGAVVSRDVPDGAIVARVPARVVGDVKTFREKVAPRTVRIRSLPFAQKKEAILARFTE